MSHETIYRSLFIQALGSFKNEFQLYLCDPQSPWQLGSNENTNRLLRDYLQKGTELSVYSQRELNWIARELNERPGKTLDYETPAARFNACVAHRPVEIAPRSGL